MSNLMQVDPAAVIGTADGQNAEIDNFNKAARTFADTATNSGFKGATANATVQLGERVNSSVNSFNNHTSERVQAMRQLTNDTLASADESSGQLNGVELAL
ncbi:hypothetical protein [Corynebacterium sp. AOP12-C2-36]|uniref:hypothetical protein n=1 Tax=Corynebacterium sp. AOP12-C2-36 TaxID=3457723 RepID=UPI004033D471